MQRLYLSKIIEIIMSRGNNKNQNSKQAADAAPITMKDPIVKGWKVVNMRALSDALIAKNECLPDDIELPKPPSGVKSKQIVIVPVAKDIKDRIAETDRDITAVDTALREKLAAEEACIATALSLKKDIQLNLSRAERQEEAALMHREMILLKIKHNENRRDEATAMHCAIVATKGYNVADMQEQLNEEGDLILLVPTEAE